MLTRRDLTGSLMAMLGSLVFRDRRLAWAKDLAADSTFVPADLPLPRSKPSSVEWIRRVVILQPWGGTQYTAMANGSDLPRQLREEFGFNALIVLPTDAHNALVDFLATPQFRLTDAQFRKSVDAYRKQGFRLVFYSSVMHCGHAPAWQTGQLEREHPDWSQRDAQGNLLVAFGHAGWLCGSSPARKYTLDYTLRLLHDYSPDGFMLDNNGFGHTEQGWTCYCDHCQQRFRKYVLSRCGADWIKENLHLDPQKLAIPSSPGLLFNLWAQWRNRVWAEIDELFRSNLRKINPQILFFANTQYDLPVNTQASSLEFEREDVVFSETHQVDPLYISQKMALGQALAAGVPLWDYIGTFAETPEGGALEKLRAPELLRKTVPVSLAHGARPWIVYFGFDDPQSQPGLQELARYLSWFVAHPGLFAGSPNTPVVVVVSLRARDLLNRVSKCVGHGVVGCYLETPAPQPLIPRHMETLQKLGVPLFALREIHLSPAAVRPFKIVTFEPGAVMTKGEVRILSNWVQGGGYLITVPDAGRYDELGRELARPLLQAALGLNPDSRKPQKVGKGHVVLADAEQFSGAVETAARSFGASFTLPVGIEVLCNRTPHHHIIHFLRHDEGTDPVSVGFPAWLGARPCSAEWFSPDWTGSKMIPIKRAGDSMGLQFPSLPPYSVVAFRR